MVERALGDVEPLGDVVEAHRVVAALAEQLRRHGDDLLHPPAALALHPAPGPTPSVLIAPILSCSLDFSSQLLTRRSKFVTVVRNQQTRRRARSDEPTTRTSDYTVEGTTAVITINRPERYNAFRGRTVEELIRAFRAAWADRAVHAVILTGAGEKAFCTGGDVKQRAETGDYGPTESGMFEIGYLHKLIRDIPKPVIAAVNGVAVGGGHVLHVLCDLSIAVGDRPVRPGRPEGRLVRRRVRLGVPRAGRRREAGAGDVVPLPALRRRDRRALGPGERGRPGRPS